MRNLLVLILVFHLQFAYSQNQFNFNTNCKEAYNTILNLDFVSAQEMIDDEKIIRPDNLIPFYLENYIDFLILNIGENEQEFNARKKKKNVLINILEDGNRKSPYYRLCLANVNLQWAFVRLKFREYLKAFFEIRSAYNLLEENQKEFPDFIPNKIGLGLLHTIIGSLPDDYNWIANILGFKGSVSHGTNEVYSVLDSALNSKKYSYLLEESVFYLSFIELTLSNDESRSLKLLGILDSLGSSNSLLVFAHANILLKNGFNDEAIKVLKNRVRSDSIFEFHYLDFLLGRAKLNRMDNDADSLFLRYIREFNGMNYKAAACQKLAWFYLLQGDTIKYKDFIKKSLNYENSSVDEDDQAKYEAKNEEIPNILLLKSRLFFDGGYYLKALSVLNSDSSFQFVNTRIDSLEYFYRLGRIYDELDKNEDALKYYDIAIEKGGYFKYYFAGNAALKAGLISEREKQYALAEEYYNICLELDFDEYERSIKTRAKAGLNRINSLKRALR